MPKEAKPIQVGGLDRAPENFTPQRARSVATTLEKWFRESHRDLPWRRNRDPYRIWISEVMLQQTTVKAVIPFFERFVEHFPSLSALASADLNEVYTLWSGLGYYSRARNLLKAASELHAQGGFPRSFQRLLEFPGFGPYTARAVSSQAFSERVGVVDGNAIRVLSRLLGQPFEAWTDQGRQHLQRAADQLVAHAEPSHVNQAVMELGATTCTPINPTCILCPVRSQCVANAEELQSQLPLKKPRKLMEQWQWTVLLPVKKRGGPLQVPLLKNDYAPFLKDTFIFPGSVQLLKKRPARNLLSHTVTHHKIYIQVREMTPSALKKLRLNTQVRWVTEDTLPQISPHKILQKALSKYLA